MFRRLPYLLMALTVALASAMPVPARAMLMPQGMPGGTSEQPCAGCPDESQTGTNPDKMPACPFLACIGTIATLPTPVLLPERVFRRVLYLTTLPTRQIGAAPSPDPFPPRPIALI